jgi:N-ethylmaleimide reductase
MQLKLEPSLLSSFSLGDLPLGNRVVMASMTRGRATNANLAPTSLHVEYYRQRASAGLIVTEATWVNTQAIGSINVPGLFNTAQADAWRRVTEAVHADGGRIYAQIGHSGAVSHPDLLEGGLPLAPSAINPYLQSFTARGFKDTVTPRAMTLTEIDRTVADYAKASRNARQAGFDGVELHASNTYLLPQFLSASLNQRNDRYGGSPENRSRIVIEILKAMIAEWPDGKIGIKISPGLSIGGFDADEETVPTYDFLVERLDNLPLSHLQIVRRPSNTPMPRAIAVLSDTIGYYRARYRGAIVANGGYDRMTGAKEIALGRADLISFGEPFIANPDLVHRFARDLRLSSSDRATYYQGGPEGYVDHQPFNKTSTADT